MAATTAGAVKAYVEGLGLGVPVFRGGAPETHGYPFATVQEGIAYRDLGFGDLGDFTSEQMTQESVQVDLYERAGSTAGATQGHIARAENYSLADKLHRRLHGARLPLIGTAHPSACRVQTRRRWPITDNVLRTTLTLLVDRPLQT